MKKLFRLHHHPKLILLLATIIFAYVIFQQPQVESFLLNLSSYGYISTFIAGILFAFGFTTPFAVGFFLTASISNMFFSSLVAGIGCTLATLGMFHYFKFSFEDEIEDLERTKDFQEVIKIIDKEIPHRIRIYLAYAFIGLILASPIPNEFSTFMLAGLKRINKRVLTIITFVASTLGIYIIMYLGN
ncbi:MAG: hypothetical protein AABW82_03035 [Nanoarchaeota archaeon]